jgi:hypothetical protein
MMAACCTLANCNNDNGAAQPTSTSSVIAAYITGDVEDSEAAAELLERKGACSAVEHELLVSLEVPSQIKLISLLGTMKCASTVDTLLGAIEKPDAPGVRDAATLALRKLPDEVVVPKVFAMSEATDDPFALEALIGCMGGRKSEKVRLWLLSYGEYPNPKVRRQLYWTLSGIPGQDVDEFLEERRAKEVGTVRRTIEEAIWRRRNMK